jgi:hypothetical protein
MNNNSNNNNEDVKEDLIVECPHCKDPVLIQQLNCRIFRHGTLKHNGIQMEPHTPKELNY